MDESFITREDFKRDDIEGYIYKISKKTSVSAAEYKKPGFDAGLGYCADNTAEHTVIFCVLPQKSLIHITWIHRLS